MIKKIVIAGCRDFNNYDLAKQHIDFCINNIKKKYELVFVSGGCKGADLLGERYAKENDYALEIHPANWEKYGKAAGPIRNKKMAEDCDYAICFWNGKSKGTKSMINYARMLNKPIRIKKI